MTSWVVVGVVTVRETVRTSLVSHMRIAWEPPAKPRPRGIEARRGRRAPRGLGTVVPGMVSERAATILVVDDDRAIADTVADGLAVAGHRTLRAATGAEALEVLRTQRPDLVILDVTMPHVDGWTVLETMRRRGLTTPVVMLTARHEREDVVRGLRLGADDYVAKPFGLEELLLRVGAVLRRAAPPPDATRVLECGALRLDLDAVTVTQRGADVALSPTEYRLLEELMRHREHVVSKADLLERVWGYDADSESTVVETYVSYLRRKLTVDGESPIVTVRGFGVKVVALP